MSRLGNPLFNEVIVPMARKDEWNSKPPSSDGSFAQYVDKPELQTLLPALYPNTFPHLEAYTKPRADLDAILLTGIPSGVVPGFQNYTGSTKADMLRLNLAIPPAKKPNNGGLVAGDAAGFPNGRRIADDVVTIELRAIAGATIPLVDPSYEAGRRGGRDHRRDDGHQRTAAPEVPVPGPARRRLPDQARHDERVMTAAAAGHGEPVGRAGLGAPRHRRGGGCARRRDAPGMEGVEVEARRAEEVAIATCTIRTWRW